MTATRRRLAALAIAAAAAASLALTMASGVTYATWQGSTSFTGATIAAGDLDLSPGEFSWTATCANGTVEAGTSLDNLNVAPGRVVTLRQGFAGRFVGDNLGVRITATMPGLPAQATATWHLADDEGTQLGQQVAAGEPIAIPDLAEGDWDAVVTVTVPDGELGWVDPTVQPAPATISLGRLVVQAQQVRCGGDFADACPAGGSAGA